MAAVQSLIIRAIQGVVIAGIAGLDEQRIAVVQRKCSLLCSGKFCFPLLAQFCQMFVQRGDQFMGRIADNFQRGFQLGQFPAGTPPGHITKGILGCVQPVVLADGIGHAFGLHLAGAAVRAAGLFRVVGVDGVQLGMGNFVDSRLDGLQLAHALLDGNAVVEQMKVAVRPALDVLKPDWHRGSLLQCLEKILVVLHAAGQFIHGDRGQRFALGLADIEHGNHLKGRNLHRLFFRQRLAVLVQNRLALFVQLFHLLLDLVGRRGKDFDAFFALFHGAVERVFPLVEARHQLSALHGDQQGVVEAVIVEFCHRGEVGFVAVAVEQLLNPCFQPVRDFFHALCAVFAVQDNGENLLQLRLTLDGRRDVGRISQNFRRRKGQYPVFLRHRLALVDFLPLVPAFDKVAILGKHALLLLGHMPAKLRRVDAAFPFFRHIYHAGTVQVVIS